MAASIVAKVTRDRIMLDLDRAYPEYGFGSHKGYATRAHIEAIDRCGPCPCHRKSFSPVSERIAACRLPGLE
jgi:ribonuclease HII